MNQYKVGLLGVTVIAWLCIIFFTFCALMSLRAGQGYVTPLFICFVILGVYILFFATRVEFNDEIVSVFSPFAEYRMHWSDVERVEIGVQSTIVFIGHGDKRLVVPSPFLWSGGEKQAACEFIHKKISGLNVQMVTSGTADYKFHKGVKVKND